MAISRKNMAVYNKVLTAFFKDLLEWQPRARSLAKKVYSAGSFGIITQIMVDDLKKVHPYGTPEDNWMGLMRDTNSVWHKIKAARADAGTDAVALGEIIALYNKIFASSYDRYISDALKKHLFEHAKSLGLDDAARKVLDAFVLPSKNNNNAKTSGAGLFAKSAVNKPAQPDTLQRLTGDVDALKHRMAVVEEKVGITVKSR